MAADSVSSSAIGASEYLRRRNDGVANCLLALLGVCASSSCFRFTGVPPKASRYRRLLDDWGVRDSWRSDDDGEEGLLGVLMMVGMSGRVGRDVGLEGVALDTMSKMPRT